MARWARCGGDAVVGGRWCRMRVLWARGRGRRACFATCALLRLHALRAAPRALLGLLGAEAARAEVSYVYHIICVSRVPGGARSVRVGDAEEATSRLQADGAKRGKCALGGAHACSRSFTHRHGIRGVSEGAKAPPTERSLPWLPSTAEACVGAFGATRARGAMVPSPCSALRVRSRVRLADGLRRRPCLEWGAEAFHSGNAPLGADICERSAC